MKLKSLILGSIAAAGLSTAGFAADLGVLTSLDVCDELGLSGLTISSDTNCLQITGGVTYEFNWGDFNGKWTGSPLVRTGAQVTGFDPIDVIDNDVNAAVPAQNGIWVDPAGVQIIAASEAAAQAIAGPGVVIRQVVAPVAARAAGAGDNDWNSKVEAWLQFVGSAGTDFGTAKAVIKLKGIDESKVANEGAVTAGDTQDFKIDQAYVSVGDSTVIMAGRKSSVANFGDDTPYGFLGLFNSSAVDAGVHGGKNQPRTGGNVIQITTDLGEGIKGSLGLENLNSSGSAAEAGTLVGVLSYSGSGITAHITALAGGILDGVVEDYSVHAGIEAKFDAFKVTAAGAANYDTITTAQYWNGLLAAEATFDMFTIALNGEVAGGNAASGMAGTTDYGIGGAIGAKVTDTVAINLAGRFYNDANGPDLYQVAAQLVAAVSETVKLTGEVGVYGTNKPIVQQTDFYGKAALEWTPGGSFTSSIGAEAHQNGAYKVTFKAAKTFQ